MPSLEIYKASTQEEGAPIELKQKQTIKLMGDPSLPQL